MILLFFYILYMSTCFYNEHVLLFSDNNIKVYLKYHLGERVGLGEDRAPAKCLAHGKFSTSTSWVNSWNSRETWVRGTKRSPGGREDRGAAREGVRFQICCVSDLQVGLFTQRDNHILGGGWILNVCRKVWTE